MRRNGNRDRFRSSEGFPVGCELYVEENRSGEPEILRVIEIPGSHGVRILSQSELDEEQVLLSFRQWRTRPENQDRIRRVDISRDRTEQEQEQI